MSDTATARASVLPALRKADSVIGVGDVRGWSRPKAYTDSLTMLNAARAAATAVPTTPPLPEKPKDVAKWVEAAAEHRARESARREVADELILTWERETAAAGLAATADICAALIDVFDELVEKFDAHADAPRQVNGYESDEQLQSHSAAVRIAGDLSAALMQRATIADAANEGEHIGSDAIWLVIDPHADTTRDGIEGALETFKSRIPSTLTEWDSVRPLGLRLAQLGEVAARRERHAKFVHTMAMTTPDLGMHDRTYSEIEDNPPGEQRGRRIQAESDDLFAGAEPMRL